MTRWKYTLFLINLLISVFFLFSCTQSIRIESSVHDVDITAHLYKPSGEGPFPAVIVLHTIAGMQPHVLKFSSALSRKGYVTVAVDYFSGREKLPYNMLGYYQHIKDTYDYLKALPMIDHKRIAMVGFSLGPRKALEFVRNSNEPIQGIVSYYVGRLRYVPSGLREYPPILFLHGEWDQETDPELVRSFCEAQQKIGRVCELHIYKAVRHAFTHKSRYRGYSARATADAFDRTVHFLDKNVKNRSE
jgi:carboxymethylenebutenolidase